MNEEVSKHTTNSTGVVAIRGEKSVGCAVDVVVEREGETGGEDRYRGETGKQNIHCG